MTTIPPPDGAERAGLSESTTPNGDGQRRRRSRRRATNARPARRRDVRPLVPGWIYLALIALLGTATWLAGDPDFQVIRLPGGLIDEARTAENAGWTKRGVSGTLEIAPDGGAVLANGGDRAVIFRSLSLPPVDVENGQTVRTVGRVERLGAATLTLDPERQTRVFLRWFDGYGATLGYGKVASFSGQFRTSRFEAVVAPPPGTVAAELVLQARSPGAWRIDGVTLDVVRSAPDYAPVRTALIVGWTLLFVLLLYAVLRGERGRAVMALGGVLAVLVAGVAFSQASVSSAVEPLARAFSFLLPASLAPSGDDLLGSGHALGFGVLVLALLAVRRALGLNVIGVLALGVALAFATEAMQRHRPNRTPELGDVGIDLIGMLVALLAWGGYTWFEARQRRKARVAGAEAFVPVGGGGGRRGSRAGPDAADR